MLNLINGYSLVHGVVKLFSEWHLCYLLMVVS